MGRLTLGGDYGQTDIGWRLWADSLGRLIGQTGVGSSASVQ